MEFVNLSEEKNRFQHFHHKVDENVCVLEKLELKQRENVCSYCICFRFTLTTKYNFFYDCRVKISNVIFEYLRGDCNALMPKMCKSSNFYELETALNVISLLSIHAPICVGAQISKIVF